MPASLSLPILLGTAAIIVARMLILNATRADRALNLAVALLVSVAAMRDETVQRAFGHLAGGLLTPSLLNHLSEATITLSSASFLLLGLAWLNKSESRAVTAAVWLAAVASVLAVEWVVGTSDPRPAAAHGLHAGWAILAYSGGVPAAVVGIAAHDALSYGFSLLLLVICFRELKNRPRGLELLACVWVTVLAAGWLLQTLSVSIVTLVAATGHYSPVLNDYAAVERVDPLVDSAAIALLSAIPLVRYGVEYIRAELYSRFLSCRLNAFWGAMTAVCPEIVHPLVEDAGMNHPVFQLHLRVIEIRDAVMILSRYITADMDSYSRRSTDVPELQHAIRLHLASRAKLRGEAEVPGAPAASVFTRAGLIDDAVELLQLGRRWQAATRLCAAQGHTTADAR